MEEHAGSRSRFGALFRRGKREETILSRHRATVLWALLILLAGGILWRAWMIQVVHAERNLERAGWITEETVTLNVPRGALRDRLGVPIAESVEAWNIILDARAFYLTNAGQADEMAELMSHFPGFDAAEFLSYGELPIESIPRYQMVARNAPPPVMEELKRALPELRATNSVRFEQVYRRFYPLGGFAGGLIGFVDREGKEGRSGLERGLDAELRGAPVTYRVTRDSRRSAYLLDEVPDVRSARGKDIELTLDVRLQRATESILQRGLERYRAAEAMAVVSEVRTGDLLAVAALPTINPNNPFASDEAFIWSSHALGHAHEPGSTAKILTFAAALDADVLRYDTLLDCEQGRTTINNRVIRDTHAEGVVPAWKAFQVSSNVCAWKMAQRLGAERHRDYLVNFGIGQTPRIPVNGMSAGILPPLRWIDVQHANISFGYAFSASILQMHMAVAAIANHGERMTPRIVRAWTSGEGVREEVPVESAGRVVRPQVARQVINALEEVVYGEGGTGSRGAIPGVRIAAKTGTARTLDPETRRYQNRYLASFSGFFPAEEPLYAITVWVLHPDGSHGYYGGEIAAPLFREIGQEVLKLYGEHPSTWSPSLSAAVAALPEAALAYAESNELPEVDIEIGGALMPNLVGMRARDAIELLREEGFEVVVYGTGRVAGHQPSSGAPLDAGQHVLLQLAESSEHP